MKDEIKEINIKFPGQILDYVDTKEHLLELFNHITNLQEENERLNNQYDLMENSLDRKQYVIDKAIEYIENIKFAFDFDREINKFAFDLLYTEQGEKLLNILKGE